MIYIYWDGKGRRNGRKTTIHIEIGFKNLDILPVSRYDNVIFDPGRFAVIPLCIQGKRNHFTRESPPIAKKGFTNTE